MKTTLCFTLILLAFVMFAFVSNSLAQDASPEYVVRIIYFLPNDVQPDPDFDTKLDTMINEARQFYADQMEAHGFERKTFRFETDENGKTEGYPDNRKFSNILGINMESAIWEKAKVHQVNGKFNEAHYKDSSISTIFEEIEEQFDMSKNIYFIALGGKPFIYNGKRPIIGLGSGNSVNGWVLIPISNLSAAIHELGHAFGLKHDYYRINAERVYTSNPLKDSMTHSFCAAEWLNVHRYFNLNRGILNENTSVEMLTPDIFNSPYALRLRFEITDPDGLNQAQLFKTNVIACAQLDGKKTTIEFVITELIGENTIILRVMDVHGNFTSFSFPIDITTLPSLHQIISIPDTHLASAVRETLDLEHNDNITQIDMLRLRYFNGQKAPQQNKIRDLTGFEYAANIRFLYLMNNSIRDITPLARLDTITHLDLSDNEISDVSPLAELDNLRKLYLVGNPIEDEKPLLKLLQKNPGVKIYLKDHRTPLPVNLSQFRAERTNAGVVLKWTTESEVDNAGFYIYRSKTRDGEFNVVNPTMVQGAGTTGERNDYLWTDTTAKPNTVYYYQIEDVSHAGVREQLATVRLRGLVSARGKLTTIWADLKAEK